MRRIALFAFALVLLSPLLASAPAYAQAYRSWVSGTGDDNGADCSRTAPCKTFAGAIAKTYAGGEINCLDSGGFGAVAITKSISIYCEGVVGGMLGGVGTSVIINASATDRVVLRGLDIDGAGLGLNGVRIQSAGFVQIEDCNIRNNNIQGSPNGNGILVSPISNLKLVISRTSISNNAYSAILFQPSGSASVTATIDRVTASNNNLGIVAITNGSTSISLAVNDSTISGHSNVGIATANSNINIMVTRTSLVSNGLALNTSGGGAVIRIGQSTITGNGTVAGGNVLSYGTNQVGGNGSMGTFTLLPAPALN